MLIPLIPLFEEAMSLGPPASSWLLTSTLICGAIAAPLLGRLGDMYGKRLIVLLSLALMAASSLLAACAANFEVLLTARCLQGAALGVLPLSIGLVRDVAPRERVSSGVGLISSSLGIGGSVGPPLTGAIAEYATWRVLFVFVAAGSVALIGLVLGFIPESSSRTGGRFDVVGSLGLAAALLCLLLATTQGSVWGWGSLRVISLFVTASVILLLWTIFELQHRSPLVNLRVAARPQVLWTNIASFLLGFGIFAMYALGPSMVQAPIATGYGFGLSLTQAGLVLLPMGVCMVLFSPVSAHISNRWGPRVSVVAGSFLLAVGNLSAASLTYSLWQFLASAIVSGIGTALAYSALPLLIMRAVPTTETGAANSVNALARQLGASAMTAFSAAVVSSALVEIEGHPRPEALGYVVSFAAAAVAAVLALMIAALLPIGRAVVNQG
jgi:MFS family permease